VKRVILGSNPSAYSGGYGLWVSKPGKDATSSNAADFLFAPGVFNAGGGLTHRFASGDTLPLVSSGSEFSKAENAVETYYEKACVYAQYFSHGLGYVPMVWSDIVPGSPPTTYYTDPPATGFHNGDPSFSDGGYWCIYADSSQVGVELHVNMVVGVTSSGVGTFSFTLQTSVTFTAPLRFAVWRIQIA
jgi:hypothetical protein